MEFKATYPFTKYDSLHKLPMWRLRNYRGSFGRSLNVRLRRDLLKRVPSHARAEAGAFPRWKQTFIRQNRQLYRKHKSWIDGWLNKIQKFPSSYQKLEWNCQGEDRDIWKYVIQFRASGVRVKRPTTAPSLVAMTTTQIPIIAWERRYMTVRECARLQSMEGLKHMPTGVVAATAFGNAVNVTVVKAILRNLVNAK
jgi:DNA (cytosine-5)-methyltransferase 1